LLAEEHAHVVLRAHNNLPIFGDLDDLPVRLEVGLPLGSVGWAAARAGDGMPKDGLLELGRLEDLLPNERREVYIPRRQACAVLTRHFET